MITLSINKKEASPLRILLLGAHSDDIEIGCGGTVLRLAEQHPDCEFYWAVFSAVGVREGEARRAAELFGDIHVKKLILKSFHDGFMPFVGAEIKQVFEAELKQLEPDLVFTHKGRDAHQDHRLISELTWNTFRNHLILEYEIPKYDGDMGCPNVFVPLETVHCQTKVAHIMESFESQHSKRWFKRETFLSMMRLRGMECNAPSEYAEGFCCRKVVL
jgi:LmbE family N-acetylglucosaminyl deacetylase